MTEEYVLGTPFYAFDFLFTSMTPFSSVIDADESRVTAHAGTIII